MSWNAYFSFIYGRLISEMIHYLDIIPETVQLFSLLVISFAKYFNKTDYLARFFSIGLPLAANLWMNFV